MPDRLLSIRSAFFLALCFSAVAPAATLKAKDVSVWDNYVKLTEARIERELGQETQARAGGEIVINRLKTRDSSGREIEPDDAMIHHWKGTVFVPNVRLNDVLKFVQDYDSHQRHFKEVEKSRLVSRNGDVFKIFYRLKRTKVITVVYNTDHTVVYRMNGPHNASSRSATTRIAELDGPGTPQEREKAAGEDHGFLWRLNSYWRFTERDGGVIVECESISLSRDIPFGLAWMIKGFVESVPRESLANTLSSLKDGLKAKG